MFTRYGYGNSWSPETTYISGFPYIYISTVEFQRWNPSYSRRRSSTVPSAPGPGRSVVQNPAAVGDHLENLGMSITTSYYIFNIILYIYILCMHHTCIHIYIYIYCRYTHIIHIYIYYRYKDYDILCTQ